MRLIEIIRKDLKLFRRDLRTVGLIVATPIIIMLILGYVFSGPSSSESINGVKVGMCQFDDRIKNIAISVFEIEDHTLEDGCESNVKNKVKEGELRAAFIIPYNFSKDMKEGRGTSIDLYIDSSKTQTAIVVSNAMKAFVQDVNEQVGTEFIKEAWKNLNELNDQLKYAVERLVIAKESANEIKQRTGELNDQLQEINSTLAYDYTANINESFEEIYSLLEETLQILELTSNSSLKQEIDSNLGRLILIMNSINTTGMNNSNMSDVLEASRSEIIQLSERINATFDQLEEYTESTDVVRENLMDIKEMIDNSSDRIAYVNEHIRMADEIKNNATIEIQRMHDAVVNYSDEIVVLTDDLNKTTIVLDEYTSKDPVNIIRAVTLNENLIYGEKSYFEFLSSGLIPVILIFIILFIASSAVVSERKSGTMARNFLSPTPIILFLIGKIIYLFILGMLQFALLILITYIMGVRVPLTTDLLAASVIIVVAFIALGMLIGSLSKTDNTALLTSLVVGIPMLFLSGMFFPFEMMPPFMWIVGKNLPLTLATQMLDRIIIYNTGISNAHIIPLLITAGACFLITYIIIRIKPTID